MVKLNENKKFVNEWDQVQLELAKKKRLHRGAKRVRNYKKSRKEDL